MWLGGLKDDILLLRANEKGWAGIMIRLVTSPHFERFIACTILLNAASIAWNVDWDLKHPNESTPGAFGTADLIFNIVFTVELVLRIFAEKREFLKPSNRGFAWNVFDGVLVVLANLELVLGGSNSGVTSLSPSLRIIRLVRVARIIRMMRFFRDLRSMVEGIMWTLPNLLWAGVLLLMIIFMFSVLIMQVLANRVRDDNADTLDAQTGLMLDTYFDSLARTVYILFTAVSGGISWDIVAGDLMDFNVMLGLLFCIYVAFSLFGVLNIVTAIFVQNANKLGAEDQKKQAQQKLDWFKIVKALFHLGDTNQDGVIDWDEFDAVCHSTRCWNCFKRLGLDMEFDSHRSLFHLFDLDDSGAIDIDEFVQGIEHIGGPARSKDVMRLRRDSRAMKRSLDGVCKQLDLVVSSQAVASRSMSRSMESVETDKSEGMEITPSKSFTSFSPLPNANSSNPVTVWR
jgi:voltage-gated sodium channel